MDNSGTGPRNGAMTVVENTGGLWVYRGAPAPMPYPHRHNDIEINLLVSGEFRYHYGGENLNIAPGQVAVFWAARPHQLLASSHGEAFWLHLPLEVALAWQLSSEELSGLLGMEPRILEPEDLPYDAATMFETWYWDIVDPLRSSIATAEVQALIRRALLQGRSGDPGVENRTTTYSHTKSGQVGELAQFMTAHFREPLTTADIAAAVHLSPSYAMAVFKEITGMTLGQYLNWCRVSEAQRLLMTTDLGVAEVGATAGFGSLSSMYDHFGSECGMSPGAYRTAARSRDTETSRDPRFQRREARGAPDVG